MRVLVTGASGFIGGAVARVLVGKRIDVRVLLRPGSEPNVPDKSAVEIVRGDLVDGDSVLRAARGCAAICHAGGLYSFTANEQTLQAVNVEGTRNVIAAARAYDARLVFTSSISTIGGMKRGVIPDETQDAETIPGPYKQSKWQAEQLVRDADIDAVIVNPTFPVGWADVKPTPTGALIRDFITGRLPGYVETGMNVVDVDDVAEGHRLALERGRRGERYILGHANLMMRELLELLAEIAGRPVPRLRIPHRIALGLAYAGSIIGGRRVPLEAVRTAQEIRFASAARAVRELGLPQTPVRTALAKAVRWFQQQERTR
jgi:dihydroflavonol-4-reductase